MMVATLTLLAVVRSRCCSLAVEARSLDGARVWKEVTEWCAIDRTPTDWDQEMRIMVLQCGSKTGKQKMYRTVLATTVYSVWKERYYRKFQNKKAGAEEVIRQCQIQIATCCAKDSKLKRMLRS